VPMRPARHRRALRHLAQARSPRALAPSRRWSLAERGSEQLANGSERSSSRHRAVASSGGNTLTFTYTAVAEPKQRRASADGASRVVGSVYELREQGLHDKLAGTVRRRTEHHRERPDAQRQRYGDDHLWRQRQRRRRRRRARGGASTFNTSEKSTSGGTLTALASSQAFR